jgi:hypothetical protein
MAMIGLLIQCAIAVACVLFVVSLPIWKLPLAVTLRRVAAALFLAALVPALFFGLLAPSGPATGDGSPSVSAVGPNALEVLGGLLILSVVSYLILAIRKRLRTTSKDAWTEYVSLRSSGKRPVGDPRSTHAPSLFDDDPEP